jgi:hypothetical protein
MANQQVQNPPTGAYVLSLIGGIFALLGGLVILGLGVVAGAFTFGLGLLFVGPLGIWVIICSFIVIYSAMKLKANPMEHSKYGAIILIFSLIGAWSILDFIGGILALVYKPIPSGQQPYATQPQQYTTSPPPPPQYAAQTNGGQPITRFCPGCGRVVNENVKFCPSCGKQLG